MNMSGGSQRGRLACALLKQETTVRAQISKIAARAHVLFSKMLFELVSISIAFVFKRKSRENRETQCRKHITGDLTRPWPKAWRIYNVPKSKVCPEYKISVSVSLFGFFCSRSCQSEPLSSAFSHHKRCHVFLQAPGCRRREARE